MKPWTNGDKRKFVKNGFLLIGLNEWSRLLIQLKMIQLFNNLMGGSFLISSRYYGLFFNLMVFNRDYFSLIYLFIAFMEKQI